jgi:hypothetical protein
MATSVDRETRMLQRECYGRTQKLDAEGNRVQTDEEIGQLLNLPAFMVKDYADKYAARLEGEVVNDQATETRKAAWRERTELVYDRLDRAYVAGNVPVEKYVDGYVKLAKTAFTLDGLDAAKRMDITAKGSKIDQAIESLLEMMPVEDEEDIAI